MVEKEIRSKAERKFHSQQIQSHKVKREKNPEFL